MQQSQNKISFLAFFLMHAERRKWKVPSIHVRAAMWLQDKGELAVLRCFRGFGKSTLLEIYNAWRLYENPEFRILHQSESDGTAYKTSRGTQNVLRTHALTKEMFREGGIEQWWVHGAVDPRNSSMYSKGILSNVTSARADECQNDDVEVPKNIQTPEAREKLRFRLGEQTHILVPGGSQLFIGTPHTHDSIYDELESMGADCLTIKMFEKEQRIEDASKVKFNILFKPEYVMLGIGKTARALVAGSDYLISGDTITFAKGINGLVDLYGDSAWPERFTIEELIKRRKKTKTINEWDSQYQLHSKPIHEVRLNPEKIIPYECEPEIRMINKTLTLWLGKVQIVSVSAKFDPSSAKLHSDKSSFSVMFQDSQGRLYWHVAKSVTGDIAEFDEQGKVIGGQVWQICDIIQKYQISRIVVETNGIGGHVPSILRGALKARGLTCGVTENPETKNKNKRILGAFEPAMKGAYLWAHVDVLDEIWDEMKDWNPSIQNQADDNLDSGAGCIEQEPVRIGKVIGKVDKQEFKDWRPTGGIYEVTVE